MNHFIVVMDSNVSSFTSTKTDQQSVFITRTFISFAEVERNEGLTRRNFSESH